PSETSRRPPDRGCFRALDRRPVRHHLPPAGHDRLRQCRLHPADRALQQRVGDGHGPGLPGLRCVLGLTLGPLVPPPPGGAHPPVCRPPTHPPVAARDERRCPRAPPPEPRPLEPWRQPPPTHP